MIENPRIAVEISSVIVPDFRFGLPYCYFRLSFAYAIIWGTFFELLRVEDPRIAVGILTLFVIVSEI